MCDICGCGDTSKPRFILRDSDHHHSHQHDHDHNHEDGHHHGHDHDHSPTEIQVQQDILNRNQLHAERNRGYFEAKKITALNLVSSPGSGKTTLIEAIIERFGEGARICVVEGDQQGTLDADRIAKLNIPVIQINTGNSCHLDAETTGHAVKHLDPDPNTLVIIENVGNLMCPSLFDLGENFRVVLLSAPEGEDKPLKYPNMFDTSHVCVISKTDLAGPAGFSTERAVENALRVNPKLKIFEVSAKTGDGFDRFADWLKEVAAFL
ncbi:MAG: hydrogenase nickel incorporation protein HypB [Bacteroidales bacterium]